MTVEYFTLDWSQAEELKKNLISYFHSYENCILLDSSQFYKSKDLNEKKYHHTYDWIIGAGNNSTETTNAIPTLNAIENNRNWKFLGLSYDIKNEIEELQSQNTDTTPFPQLFVLQPDVVITYQQEEKKLALYRYHFDQDIFEIKQEKTAQHSYASIQFQPTLTKEEYLEKIAAIKQHLQRGDIYEINFCQNFKAENIAMNPWEKFQQLNAYSPMPFSAFCKLGNRYVLSASPERFIKKEGQYLLSQPMKGTMKRSFNKEDDAHLADQLKNSTKDRTENVMIVDLVRNDLSKIAVRNSVEVEELFEVYEFPNIYQMISTISCTLKENTSLVDILKATFPMGSMTGAPKIRAMELSEKFEDFKRNWYAGALGYINPENDFDFSVLIRSIFYNETLKTLNFAVGGAITNASDAEAEYEECLLKALPIFKLFEKN